MPDFDIEIVEMHHGQKVDAPAAPLARGLQQQDEIGILMLSRLSRGAIRVSEEDWFALGGDVAGDHSVILGGAKTITLQHYAGDRVIFAQGA